MELAVGEKSKLASLDSILIALTGELSQMDTETRICGLNRIKQAIHEFSPFNNEPVDCIIWVKNKQVIANDYNPNKVAPPEMELLKISIQEDGFTQPIVTQLETDNYTVIDGFHRNRVGKECAEITQRLYGYLPVTVIRPDREGRCDRIASTIRHNRARGKHTITGMTDIIVELKRRNWSNEKIGRELGMEPDEILRLSQISGLAEMFADRQFGEAWEAGGSVEDIVNEDNEVADD